MAKARAPRNRTITLSPEEATVLRGRLVTLDGAAAVSSLEDVTLHQDIFDALPHLPAAFVDLLILDPPYNKRKSFNGTPFTPSAEYRSWFESWFLSVLTTLKRTASVYVCADWATSAELQSLLAEHLIVRNRITWEREKGRGAAKNWKSTAEDIWFCTVSEDFYFDVDAVKLRRSVRAPYRENGKPKDWIDGDERHRLTHPSNFWGDLTVPFWSMPENTDHPTQKPEKLIAKLILASSKPGDVVLDPFVGSGTTSVVAKKLGRNYVGIERELEYALVCEKRLALAESDTRIQGYEEGMFWERNSRT